MQIAEHRQSSSASCVLLSLSFDRLTASSVFGSRGTISRSKQTVKSARVTVYKGNGDKQSIMSVSEKTRKDHRALYKAKTPPWKETYRKRCMARLRESREKLQEKFRKVSSSINESDEFITDLMRDELQTMQKKLCSGEEKLDIEMDELSSADFDIESVLNLFEDIQEELRQEEIKMLAEFEKYQASLKAEEDVLCSAIEQLSSEDVICPVCQKNSLLQNKSVIFCKCGVRVDTEQDCLTLKNVKRLLDEGVGLHGHSCDTPPSFSVVSEHGPQNLLMSCRSCDWMSIII
ncbi:RPA-interacting protein A-like isoform X2 [Crassostrea virginica]